MVTLVGLLAPGCNKAEDASPSPQTSAAPEVAIVPPEMVPEPAPAEPEPPGPKAPLSPEAPAGPKAPPSPKPVGDVIEVIGKPMGTPGMELPCNTEMFTSTTLPAIAIDGSKLARLSWLGSAGAAEEDGELDLLVFDASGSVLEQVLLWHPDDVLRAESPEACAALATELEQRRREANAVLAATDWRSLDRLPPLHELVGEKVVEVALVGGPTLAIRQPKVAVYAKLPMPELRIIGRDPEFARECGTAPVLLEAWRDPISNTLLLEFTGDGYVIDLCDYPPAFRVVSLSFDKPPPDDAAWGRAPAWHELEAVG
jgi:hypothetical protein